MEYSWPPQNPTTYIGPTQTLIPNHINLFQDELFYMWKVIFMELFISRNKVSYLILCIMC